MGQRFCLTFGIAVAWLSALVLMTIPSAAGAASLTSTDQYSQLSTVGYQFANLLVATPITDEPDSEAKEQREIEDLAAQKEMAFWAQPMFWATIASALAAVIGVIGLLITLKHNSEALKLSNKSLELSKSTAQAQLRPYLDMKVSESHKQFFSNNGIDFLEIIIKNYGSTPARKAVISTKYSFLDRGHDETYSNKFSEEDISPAFVIMPDANIPATRKFREDYHMKIARVRNGTDKILIDANVSYEDAFRNIYNTQLRFIIFCSRYGETIGHLSQYGNDAT